jgi:hypothetical protein
VQSGFGASVGSKWRCDAERIALGYVGVELERIVNKKTKQEKDDGRHASRLGRSRLEQHRQSA